MTKKQIGPVKKKKTKANPNIKLGGQPDDSWKDNGATGVDKFLAAEKAGEFSDPCQSPPKKTFAVCNIWDFLVKLEKRVEELERK